MTDGLVGENTPALIPPSFSFPVPLTHRHPPCFCSSGRRLYRSLSFDHFLSRHSGSLSHKHAQLHCHGKAPCTIPTTRRQSDTWRLGPARTPALLLQPLSRGSRQCLSSTCLLLVQPPSSSHFLRTCISAAPSTGLPPVLSEHQGPPRINISLSTASSGTGPPASLRFRPCVNPTGICCADFPSVSLHSRCRRQIQRSDRKGQPRYRPDHTRSDRTRNNLDGDPKGSRRKRVPSSIPSTATPVANPTRQATNGYCVVGTAQPSLGRTHLLQQLAYLLRPFGSVVPPVRPGRGKNTERERVSDNGPGTQSQRAKTISPSIFCRHLRQLLRHPLLSRPVFDSTRLDFQYSLPIQKKINPNLCNLPSSSKAFLSLLAWAT